MGENYFVLEKLNHLMISKACNLTADQIDHIDSFYHQLRFLAIILKDMDEKQRQHELNHEAENLSIQIYYVICKTRQLIRLFDVEVPGQKDSNNNGDSFFDILFGINIMEEIKTIEAKVAQFYGQINQIQLLQDDQSFNHGVHSSMSMSMSMENRTMGHEEITVGFDDEALTIKELLAGGKKQLQMISIFGMPGLNVDATSGWQWATTASGFPRLKFLKLKDLDVKQWITCSSHFPSLQHLSLDWCQDLKEAPSSFGDILTLQLIENEDCLAMASLPCSESNRNGVFKAQLEVAMEDLPLQKIPPATMRTPPANGEIRRKKAVRILAHESSNPEASCAWNSMKLLEKLRFVIVAVGDHKVVATISSILHRFATSDALKFSNINPGIMLLIFTKASGHVPLKILSIEDGTVLKTFKHLFHQNKKVDFIE
ncbi:hypothetical protein LOK49_LG11G00391 [Camellia lanceoleosa]|uniref:Uncharacterized protein n=1 Tax=Camellia lanceoleosa TaxID=1840588 RepID=A0ACC0G033_9ERIC|nr:hypothetical protein LOK49_LG11G00391 [Camellia lanceoleosa]